MLKATHHNARGLHLETRDETIGDPHRTFTNVPLLVTP